ncbi:cytochrome c5 family protein [Allopusillimonas soli]|uniref:Cytochrome c5 family protein n=1 Tax=Allopusillimonas soli TaxID=659016 RepID=A0A853F6T0_9BURK|nr:c-type cytochrome [Allopusillimonas soli]NYT36285.1 cytochrome c5 family protein [Allopusillimonas soli]TEA76609.1 cytochrome c5 family protein [Allopusillimonas soli]
MNNTEAHIEETIEGHEGFIKTPKQLIVTVILAFIVPIVVIIMLTHLVAASMQSGAGSDAQKPESIAARIKPVADFKLVDANAPKVYKTGQQVFESTCTACHTAGVAGAPKIGDKAAWKPFIDKGYEDMVKNALHGIGAMPPKGGNPSLSDFEVERAVVYMANKAGAGFDEPKEPAPAGDKADADTEKQAAAPAAAAAATPAAEAKPAEAKPAEQTAAAKPAEAEKAAEPAADKSGASADGATETAAVNPAGEKLYKSVCFACHAAGVAGAPKFGNKEDWAKFIATGIDAMVANAIKGVGAMPPRGGSQASDEEMRAAVEYMVSAAK